MKRIMTVALILALSLSGLVVAGNNTNAQGNASVLTPYQLALRGTLDLEGNKIPVHVAAELPADEASFWKIAWANPIGRYAEDSPLGPGRKNDPDKGTGKISVQLFIDGVEVAVRQTNDTRYTTIETQIGPITGWWHYQNFWIEFPPSTFEADTDHTFRSIIYVPNFEGFPVEFMSTVYFY